MTPNQFFELLYNNKPDTHKICLWCLDTKSSDWADNTALVEKYVKINSKRDIYFGLGTVSESNGDYRRATVSEVRGIPGIWLDIDIAGVGHKKNNLVPNVETALELLKKFEHAPTVIVHSGGGLHVYWVFKEFWTFENASEHTQAIQLLNSFQSKMAALFKPYAIDMVHDLARVLRIPGSTNWKDKENPRAVTIHTYNANARYSVSDISDSIELIELPQIQSDHKQFEHLTIDPNLHPPFDKFMVLCENSDSFKRTVEHSRDDLADSSPSAYDFSLAIQTINVDWTDQEIVNLLLYFRKKNNFDLKLDNKQYYYRTIAKAHEKITHDRQTRGNESPSSPTTLENIPSEISDKDGIRAELKDLLGGLIEIETLEKTGKEDAEYTLILKGDNRVAMGGVKELFDQSEFRNKLCDALEVRIPGYKKAAWFKICDTLWKLLVVVDTGSDWKIQAFEWLDSYLVGASQLSKAYEKNEEALPTKSPINNDKILAIHVPSMLAQLTLFGNERGLKNNKLRSVLNRIGFKPVRLTCKDPESEKRLCVRYYQIDRNIYDKFISFD